MEFKLNEYRQGVSNEELLADVKKVSEYYNSAYLSIVKYEKIGKFSETTLRARFGSWENVLQALGLRTEKNKSEMQRISNEELIIDLKRVATILHKETVTYTEYNEYGKFSNPTILERFGSWNGFVTASGLQPTGFIKKIDDELLFEELEKVWISLGKQPTTTDMKKGISKYSLDTYMRRFGGWRNALKEFVNYINTEETITDEEIAPEFSIEPRNNCEEKIRTIKSKRTSRNINLRIRFKVLNRDRFCCVSCGASPARNPNTELHVDHIIPWSKGGETVVDNLQTLCSTCNLGKSDLTLE